MTYFYGHLFAAEPEIRAMFPAAMDGQRQRLYRALRRIAADRNDRELARYLTTLGRAHRKFGVRKEHYAAFRAAMQATVERFTPPGWSADAKDEWEGAVDRAIEIMVTAAEEDAAHAPAWWTAEVTSHELRTPQIAMLTLQPSEPFPYLAGQHLWVQTPRWPRLWRRYSIANAPRDDGSLTLHVRAVAGGLISTTLVHHLTPGDTLLLGPSGGRMTVDTESARPVLCLAGGTGLAPLKAIAEALTRAAETGKRRDIVLYHGARNQSELYDLPELRRMEGDYPWLNVITATSDEMAEGSTHGTIPDLAATTDWADRDVYISGPDAMIAKTVETLRAHGAHPELLRCDPAEETAWSLRRRHRPFGILCWPGGRPPEPRREFS
jgi:NAD(P)H-flavin reductase/hemoglobin-like flavoprotein